MTLSEQAALDLDVHRRELTGYCYRMLGSAFDADDAVQETMVRAWRAADSFEGRSSVRSWLYRIATNICIDMIRGRNRRAFPMELGPSCPPVEASLAATLPEGSWVSPIADERVLPIEADPAAVSEARESVRLAFVAALQHLPARQRAVLILCEVLRWQAAEVAELLDTSVAAVNSTLQRARAALPSARSRYGDPRLDGPELLGSSQHSDSPQALDGDQRDLLARYLDAFERYDVQALVNLLHEDAVQSMPPYAMWLQGAADIGRWMLGVGAGCRGSRLLPTAANGCPAFAQYRPDPAGGHAPWALHVLKISAGRIGEIHSFLDTAELFPAFGLPVHLPA